MEVFFAGKNRKFFKRTIIDLRKRWQEILEQIGNYIMTLKFMLRFHLKNRMDFMPNRIYRCVRVCVFTHSHTCTLREDR